MAARLHSHVIMSFAPLFCANKECRFSRTPGRFIRKGFFRIAHNQQKVRRFQCKACKRTFSSRTFNITYRQHFPQLNEMIYRLHCEGCSIRAIARVLKIHRMTVSQKLLWLFENLKDFQTIPESKILYFDEMESFEHSKAKPLTIPIFVNEKYEILAIRVGEMPAKGHLAKISIKKYGPRRNESPILLDQCFQEIKKRLPHISTIFSDKKSNYPALARKFYPYSQHHQYSRKDEEKEPLHELIQKRQFQPLFTLNQRCAKIRSDIKRMVRRTWCTTKLAANLEKFLQIYAIYNNLKGAYPL
jgi:transposase-like protein